MIGGPIDPTRQAFDRGRDLIAESRAQQRVREIFAEHEAAYARTGDPLAQPPPPLGEVEGLARQLGRPEFLRQVPPQPILQNFALSIWEFVHGQTVLTSRPWNLSLPVADLCNARCTFCTSWLDGRKLLDLDDLDRFESVLGTALQVGLTGHGEPLAHPQFDELCDRLTAICDARAILYTITNGYFLSKWRDQLDRSNLRSYSISLNAATAETHDAVMGLGPDAFPRIIEAISGLVELGRRPGRSRTIWISMVVTRQNLAEIPAFVELGNRLGITTIRLGTLLPQAGLLPGLNYHLLPPYLHPEFDRLRQSAVAAIRDSQIPVVAEPRSWEQRVLPEVIE